MRKLSIEEGLNIGQLLSTYDRICSLFSYLEWVKGAFNISLNELQPRLDY